MGVNLLMNRRRMLENTISPYPIVTIDKVSAKNIASETLELSNANGTTINSNTYSGEIIVTQESADYPNNPADYRNGFFAIGFPTKLPQKKHYLITADVIITNSILNTDLISVASFGTSSTAVTTNIKNGKMSLILYHIENLNRNYITFRVCGNSMRISNIRLYAVAGK